MGTQVLIAARVASGGAAGVALISAPQYIAEIADTPTRGGVVSVQPTLATHKRTSVIKRATRQNSSIPFFIHNVIVEGLQGRLPTGLRYVLRPQESGPLPVFPHRGLQGPMGGRDRRSS